MLPIETEQQDHLLFPNGDRKLRRGLQILDERLATRLNDADLWKLLDPDLARLLQVKYPFLQAIQRLLTVTGVEMGVAARSPFLHA